MDSPENKDKSVLEAATIYLLMKKGFPISRHVRAQWILDHLDTLISVQSSSLLDHEEAAELEIVSVIPKNPPMSWTEDTSHCYLYRVSSTSSVIFLAHKYRMVFCLDLSPSLGTIDIQHGEIVMDEVCMATKQCLKSVSRPFPIAGSKYVLEPEIYVTIIVHTPFFTNPAQQVLVQGWLIKPENVNYIMQFIEKRLSSLEEKIAQVTGVIYQNQENYCNDSGGLVSGLFEEKGSRMNMSMSNANVSVISPDASFINMLRYGLLALSFLPEYSSAHLIIISDGIVGATDIYVLDSVVQQFRASTVACSFIHLGSDYHPHCANGLVPYQDLLCFLATATLGSYMTFTPNASESEMSIYQQNLLCWTLYRVELRHSEQRRSNWYTENSLFYGQQQPQLLRKKLIDDKVTCTLSSLLCCRLRDGYLIKKVTLRDGCVEICFVLPWKTHVFFEYAVSSAWPPRSSTTANKIQYTITVEAPYEFLHDITCLSKKPLKSQYRQSVISRFWATLSALTESNNMLEHFSWFPEPGWTWYNVPDTIKSGMPVFSLPPYPSASTVQISDSACPQFGKIWSPVASLDTNQWARWMHSQCVTLILTHDRPLPKSLHQANQSGRFQCVQYRQAAAVLYAMLKNWATFVLVENHTYVQFIYREVEKPPVSFSVIRVNCKALCVVLNVAFAGGTEGIVRYNVVMDLVDRVSKLTLPNRPTEQRETPCCTIIHKALERILIRYERMPSDMSTLIFPDGTQPIPHKATPMIGGNLTTTLSRYLYHNRWLWNVKKPIIHTIPGIVIPRLNITAISRIISTITKMRLTEGFNFAYSAAGIINMVLEVQMQGPHNDHHPCIIQYIVFPPHTIYNPATERDSESEEDTDGGTGEGDGCNEDYESSGDFQIVTEVWIEPQCGHINCAFCPTASYMNSLSYHQLPNAIAQIDEECINALLTLEHLSLLSHIEPRDLTSHITNGYSHSGLQYGQNTIVSQKPSRRVSIPTFSQSKFLFDDVPDERIYSMLFNFDILNILSKCQQVELVYSMFADSSDEGESTNNILMEDLMDHMKRLHSKEVLLSASESVKFTETLLKRPREDGRPFPFSVELNDKQWSCIRWRCFIKGISVSHIIVTMLPASERDVRALAHCKSRKVLRERSAERPDSLPSFYMSDEKISACSLRVEEPFGLRMVDFESGLSSRTTTAESTPKIERARRRVPSGGPKSGLTLPIYVYDCSSTGLVDVIVGKFKSSRSRDIYQNNLFATSQQNHEEFIHVKTTSGKSTSPEPKSEDSDNLSNDQRKLLDHCKLIGLAQCHCYVVAVYKALLRQLQPLYEDLEAAVDQCEESVLEINITDYLRNVCKHLAVSNSNTNDDSEYSAHACTEFQAVHNLIKEKFRKLINIAFKSVHAQSDFYFYSPHHNFERINSLEFHHSDSDDDFEAFTFHSETHDCKLDSVIGKANLPSNATWPNTNHRDDPKVSAYDSTESLVSNLIDDEGYVKDQPLFLQLNCSIYCGKKFTSVPVKLLPTCFGDMHQWIDEYEESDIQSNFKVTLDIICLKLPKDVLEVNLEHSGGIINPDLAGSPETDTGLSKSKLKNLPPNQDHAINTLAAEIEWLLKDEIITALLDTEPPTEEALNMVANHVTESNGRPSCHFDKVPLHFVFSSTKSTPKFMEELEKMKVDRYTMCRLKDFLYFVKNQRDTVAMECETKADTSNDSQREERTPVPAELDDSDGRHDINSSMSRQGSVDVPENQSEVSSIGERRAGTDDGYEGDSSNYEDDCFWLVDLDRRRETLPNFWLIMQIQRNYVEVYFHCRFLEFSSPEVDSYRQVQKLVVSQIAAICRRVNQYLLLESLHDMRTCDLLLEPESHEDHLWRGESNSESGVVPKYEATTNLQPGTFRCPVVWEETFCLHPRLKTGPGRPGLSRGIKALQLVLSRFSVNNRDNMFVYRESNFNVFYLRLDEQTSDGKSLQNKLSESDERLMVSRSNSVASLSQSRGHQTDSTKSEDTRPRVRSFGEKDSDYMNKYEDSIVLMVHGISEPGQEVRRELVQVLHNRLDDAVLEVLSVMLARNPMCKLTPADVHFIQKPYRPPETYVQFTVHPHYLQHVNALAHYLRQNILQFLYIPKYTDPRAHYHLQDYSQPENSKGRVPEADIFLNNQSQSSGNRGIACIAMAIDKDLEPSADAQFPHALRIRDFSEILSTSVYEGKTRSICLPNGPIEFRIWMQGRVNVETLIDKLKAAIKHATWDLVMEYYLLPVPLAVASLDEVSESPKIEELAKNPEHRDLNAYELGEKGQLHLVYHKTLPCWFQFALDIGVPSVKKHTVTIRHRHPIPTAVKELQNLIRANAPDTSTRAFLLRQRQPFVTNDTISPETYLPFKETDGGEVPTPETDPDYDEKVYIPFEFRADDHKSYSNAVIVARNFSQWKASKNPIADEELLMPKDKKLLQRFNPLIQDSKHIPRQRLLLAKVQSNQIILYMYNWSKERSEKLIQLVTNLSLWLSFRSALLSNVVLQKIGIFRHPTDPYDIADEHGWPHCSLTDIEAVSKFVTTLPNAEIKEWPRTANRAQQTARGLSYSWERMVGQVMRDAKPTMHYPANMVDPIAKAAHDLHDLQQRERKNKENLTRLYTMWQSRSASPNIPISTTNLNTFKQHSRLIHYCHTPILFLPQWRLQSAATRDHSLTPPSSTSPIGSQTHDALRRSTEINAEKATLWHQELCASMIAEYKQYLELLGFHPVHMDPKSSEDSKLQKACYLKKPMLGGILLFELALAEPFFTAKLQAIEYNRLQTKSSTTLINQFMLSFIDACEKIKINMHLHSFMYDYHLRCISSYISGVGQWSLQQGYHLTHFLDDFTKYYSKAPNFARNLVYNDTVTVSNLTTPAPTLYSYLLSHEKSCGMQVFGMTGEAPDTRNNEYVLVRLQCTPLVSYCEGHDVKYTDDFIVALIVSKQNRPPQLEKSEITLKYYLILTSKGEQYPKRELDDSKLGKFRTVYSVVKSTACSSQAESLADSSPATPTPSSEIRAKDDANVESDFLAENSMRTDSVSMENEVNETLAPTPPPVPSLPLMPTAENVRSVDFSAPHLFQIRQESINYLGYYSSHEQVMQQLIISQARAARQHITTMTERGMLHCRTHLLWNKLLESKSTMTYGEFMELLSLAKVESLSMLDTRLSPLINQPINWYQTLAKVLQNKYHEHHKQFSTPDGNVTHHLILHQSYLQAFMMLTIDLHTSRGELFAIYRKSSQVTNTPFGVNEIHSLIEGFVNACCFHLWMGLYSQ